MLNHAVIIGRITKDLELKKNKENKSILEFNLAVNRGKNSEPDYIACELWGEVADNMHTFAAKGDQILVEGYLKSRYITNGDTSYNKVILLGTRASVIKKVDVNQNLFDADKEQT